MNTTRDSFSVNFTGLNERGRVPEWAKTFNTERSTAAELSEAKIVPEFVVLNAGTAKRLRENSLLISHLSHRLRRSRKNWRLIVCYSFVKASKNEKLWEDALDALKLFPGSTAHIDIAFGKENLQQAFYEAFAKWLTVASEGKAKEKQTTNDDPLSEAKEVIKATRSLLAPSGRLSAKAIAKAFGISQAKLASIIGTSRQSISKTPDSPKIQSELKRFERIGRLRAVFSQRDFNAWLERPNRELDGKTPLELISKGDADIVADLAEDMLLGTPS